MEYYKKDASPDLLAIYKRLEKIENKLDSTQKAPEAIRSFPKKAVIADSLNLLKSSKYLPK
jgi:hypothetical protein